MPTVIVQNWTERERGFGPRDDGFTVHPDRAHRDAYVAWYHKTFNNEPTAPDSYTTTDGNPIEAQTTAEIHKQVVRKAGSGTPEKPEVMWGIGKRFEPTLTLDVNRIPAAKKPPTVKKAKRP